MKKFRSKHSKCSHTCENLLAILKPNCRIASTSGGYPHGKFLFWNPLPKTAFHRYYKLPCCKHLSNLFPESFSDFIKLRSVDFRGLIRNTIFKSPLTFFVRFCYFNYTPKATKFKTFYLFTKLNDIIFKRSAIL